MKIKKGKKQLSGIWPGDSSPSSKIDKKDKIAILIIAAFWLIMWGSLWLI